MQKREAIMDQQPRTSSSARRKKHNGDTDYHSPYKSKSREDMSLVNRSAAFTNTIRTVTPESIPEGKAVSTNDVERFIPTAEPTSPPNATRSRSPDQAQRLRMRAGSSNAERTHAASLRDQHQTRPRTRTLEERASRDKSPTSTSLYGRPRQHRLGSVHSISSAGFNGGGIEDAVHSIGHPTIIPANIAYNLPIRSSESSRNRLQKQVPRDLESLPSGITAGQQSYSSESNHVPPTDTRKMLQLMKSTRGRMEGPLAFRRVETVPWALSYCSINDESGSLVYEPKSSDSNYKTLIPDLRGCNIKAAWDAESHMPYLDVCPQNSKLKVHLRPHSQDEFESWFAALLCWQPIRPKGIQNRMTKTADLNPGERQLMDTRRYSEVSLHKETPVIKVGKMIFWDTNVSYSYAGAPKSSSGANSKAPTSRMQSFGSRRWRRVSCTLRENGELKLFSEQDQTLVACVQLAQLSRCAVQRLDPSVLDNDFCIAIFPQYSTVAGSQGILRAIYVSLESRVLYEVWLVLLRAFTVPQLYGPKQTFEDESPGRKAVTAAHSTTDMFRMERTLTVRIVDARLAPPMSPHGSDHDRPRSGKSSDKDTGGYYAEVLLDGEARAKTMVKSEQHNPFWREEFEFLDLPAVLSVASVVLKKRPPSAPHNERNIQKEMKRIHEAINSSDSIGGQTGISFDQQVGKVDMYLDDLEPGKNMEKWWPLTDLYGQSTGEMLISIVVEESVILMARDYQPMSEVLHRFSNGLTLQIAQMMPAELKRMSEYLLNIFQVSGKASEWIMSLIEEEIDGVTRESPARRHRFARRAGSNDSGEGTQFGPHLDRELMVRDMGKSATLEANLLFRGNTLLTKSLDFHMKRLGKEWLEETLGDKVKEIADKDPDCEVDPVKVGNLNDLDRNWRKLISWTSECWKCIYNAALKCPADLRYIFRHIRACAEERYGDFLKTVRYSSVSGFLFLRFFCPAILNPKLFGLLKDHPKPNARRTFTLIAKSIQTLANMTSFGQKEQWMEPMNTFLTSHRNEFKTFVDNVCSISSTQSSASPIPPSYSTPLAILTRLPPTSREGFPSLPYLIDHAKNFASLVNLWLDHANSLNQIREGDGDLLQFHQTCLNLRQRTEDCLAQAERAERPTSTLSFRWEELVEGLENASTHPAASRSVHSRVASSAASINTSNPESPTGTMPNRERSIDIPPNEDFIIRARSTIGRRQGSVSSAASPYSRSNSQGELQHDVTPPRTAHDDAVYASMNKSSNSSRTAFANYTGFTPNQESSKTKDRNASRQASVQHHLPNRSSTRTPSMAYHGNSSSTTSNIRREQVNQSPTNEERSWLGDVTSNSGAEEEARAAALASDRWTQERERAWRSEGEGLVRSSTANGRPTRKLDTNPSQRHAVVQQRAEEMEPGEPRNRKVMREPRRDWANEERQRRIVIDLAAERAAQISAGMLDGGMSGRSQIVANQALPPGSSHSNSYPGSRLHSRQGSRTSGDSEGDEGTTALPKMQYKNAAAAMGAELGVKDGAYTPSRERDKDRDKNVFERIGFGKKKKGT